MRNIKLLCVLAVSICAIGATYALVSGQNVSPAQNAGAKVLAETLQLDSSVPEDTKALMRLLDEQYKAPGMYLAADFVTGYARPKSEMSGFPQSKFSGFLEQLPPAKRYGMRLLFAELSQGYNRVFKEKTEPVGEFAERKVFFNALHDHTDGFLSPKEREAFNRYQHEAQVHVVASFANMYGPYSVPDDRIVITNEEVDQIATKVSNKDAKNDWPLARVPVAYSPPLSPWVNFNAPAFKAERLVTRNAIKESAAEVLSPDKLKLFENSLSFYFGSPAPPAK